MDKICLKCGSHNIIGEDPRFGWGKCRSCNLSWRYEGKYVKYSEEFNWKTWWIAVVLLSKVSKV